jgi:hypothetical protein
MLFFESDHFRKRVVLYLTDEEYAALQYELSGNPDKGDVIRDTGGARKIRVALVGRGKRGGGRVVERPDRLNRHHSPPTLGAAG